MPTKTRSKKLIIAIDGPAGSGKSTVAKAVARKLKIPYIDTGAMYRAVTLKAMNEKVSLQNPENLVYIARSANIELRDTKSGVQKVYLDGKDVTKAIRTPELTKNVFYVAQEPVVRDELVAKQRQMGSESGAVMEGRDIGTVVFPKADFKIFMDAKVEIRATRRHRELLAAGKSISYEEVLRDLKARDLKDKTRKKGPLKQAKDAIRLDTSGLTIQEVVDKILGIVLG